MSGEWFGDPRTFGKGVSPDGAKQQSAALSPAPEPVAWRWHYGEPPKPWRDEWFIAETDQGDRVVLTALPEEYTYDYKTADETYLKAYKIARWMRFPDSRFIEPTPQPGLQAEVEAALRMAATSDGAAALLARGKQDLRTRAETAEAALTASRARVGELEDSLATIANECDPEDPEWGDPIEARAYLWSVISKIMSREEIAAICERIDARALLTKEPS